MLRRQAADQHAAAAGKLLRTKLGMSTFLPDVMQHLLEQYPHLFPADLPDPLAEYAIDPGGAWRLLSHHSLKHLELEDGIPRTNDRGLLLSYALNACLIEEDEGYLSVIDEFEWVEEVQPF